MSVDTRKKNISMDKYRIFVLKVKFVIWCMVLGKNVYMDTGECT